MRPVLVVLGLVVCGVAALDYSVVVGRLHPSFTLVDYAGQPSLAAVSRTVSPDAWPVRLDPAASQGLEIRLDTRGWVYRGRLEIESTGDKYFVESSTGRVTLGSGADQCRGMPAGVTRCIYLLKTARPDADVLMVYPQSGPVKLLRVDTSTVSARRLSALTSDALTAILLTMLACGHLLMRLVKGASLRLGIVAALGVLVLAAAGPVTAATVLFMTFVGYGAVDAANRPTSLRLRRVVVGLTVLVLVVVVLKALWSYWTPAGLIGGFGFALPLGISYVAIRLADLVLSAYATRVQLSFLEYLAFLLFPPTLAAGPIMTLDQFRSGSGVVPRLVDLSAGLARVTVGLIKKTMADAWLVPLIVPTLDLLAADPASVGGVRLVRFLATTASSVYLDFSGYCDIAIGAGRALGWRVPENFDWPFLRPGLRSFWRAWHMTLSDWAMRRVFLPTFLTARVQWLSVFATMLFIGVWHAPFVSWMLWALHHTIGLTAESTVARVSNRLARRVPWAEPAFRCAGAVIGIPFVWAWVSLGHAFTLVVEPKVAIELYFRAIVALGGLGRQVLGATALVR